APAREGARPRREPRRESLGRRRDPDADGAVRLVRRAPGAFQRWREGSGVNGGTAPPDGLRRLIRTPAPPPRLPPAEALPANAETSRALVADLARGAGSTHRDLLREVGDEVVISVDELARRAEFLLACLVLPAAGTHYEVLGLERDASAHEVRRRWAALMQRYHPDHFGGGEGRGGGLDAQARRVIEAYHTVKDPERPRPCDPALASQAPR